MFKRYHVYMFSDYYPCGGFNDFEGAFDTFEEALEYLASRTVCCDNKQIVKITKDGTPRVEWESC